MNKNVLIACEESQRVCKCFRKKGFNAFSADIKEASGGKPEWHILGDVLNIINGNCHFITCDNTSHFVEKWDLIIAHPPCTYLTNSGNKYFCEQIYGEKARERKKLREQAIDFFMQFVNADCEHIAIENPVGCMSTRYRKPDCIYNPYYFEGETECKRTCLWLKNLPPLYSNRSEPIPEYQRTNNGYESWFNGKWVAWNSEECKTMRSKTPWGVARAMAEQWGDKI